MKAPALAFLIVSAAACQGTIVSVGDGKYAPYHFGTPEVVSELAVNGQRGNPTLTSDLLEIYFTTNEDPDGNGDVWSARRASKDAPFVDAAPVDAVNSPVRETSAALAPDGLTLWVGSTRPGGSGGIDIWVSQRTGRSAAWSVPIPITELNTSADDIPRPLGQHDLVMPLASTQTTPLNQADRNYQTYLARRSDANAPFQRPAVIPEIDTLNRSVVDGFLTDDGLVLFYASAGEAPLATDAGAVDAGAGAAADGGVANADLFVAFRRSPALPFTVFAPLDDLNTSGGEFDPWISPDGTVVYFTSDREGETHIFRAPILPRR
jgi:hypothetical protein